MGIQEEVGRVFEGAGGVPEAFQLSETVEQRSYLIGGELRTWERRIEDVLSPICEETANGPVPRRIGSYPILTEKEAIAALDAAEGAYANGRGAWPTLSIAERIRCVEDFTLRMVGTRTEVVRLLMWEVAKPRIDAEKEFDRTVQYIRDTIDALKELDRTSSRFVIQEGIIAQIRRAPLGVVLCLGPYNYPLNETFTTLIPALIMGNTVIVKPPKPGLLLYGLLLKPFRDAFPAGVVNFVYGPGSTVIPPPDDLGTGERPGLYRDEPGRRHPEETAPATSPSAQRPRPRRQEPGDHPARRRPGPNGEGVPPGNAIVQWTAVYGAEDPFRSPFHCRSVR